MIAKGTRQQSSPNDIIKIPRKLVDRVISDRRKDQSSLAAEPEYHPVSMIEPKRRIIDKKMPLEKISE